MSKSPDPEARVASSHGVPQMPKAALMNTSAQAYSKVVTAVSDLVEDAGNFLSCFAALRASGLKVLMCAFLL